MRPISPRPALVLSALILLGLLGGVAVIAPPGAAAPPQKAPADLPPSRVAYVYYDESTAKVYHDFLVAAGYTVDTVPVTDTASADLSSDQAILVGTDTTFVNGSFAYQWHGTAEAAAHVDGAGKPVIAIGDGAYIWDLLPSPPYIRGLMGWTGVFTGVVAVSPTDAIWTAPNPISLPPSQIVTVLPSPSAVRAVYLPSPQLGVWPLGRESDDEAHYPIISACANEHCDLLWGFKDTPDTWTDDGRKLFLNLLANHPCCELTFVKGGAPETVRPGDIVNYSLSYEYTGGCAGPAGVVITDALPAGLTYLPGSASPPADYTEGVLTWNVGTILSNTAGTYTFQAVANRGNCSGQTSVANQAHLSATTPTIDLDTDPAYTTVVCPPVDFPDDQPPYAENEIAVYPYPLRLGEETEVCAAIHNYSDVTHTVDLSFDIAPLGIGMTRTTIGLVTNLAIGPGETLTPCVTWTPEEAGDHSIVVDLVDSQKHFDARSSRCLDVSEHLVAGEKETFYLPVHNPEDHAVSYQALVRTTCEGWDVRAEPASGTLEAGETRELAVRVQPPLTGTLGLGCTVDIEVWETSNNMLVRLLGGIRKVDVGMRVLKDVNAATASPGDILTYHIAYGVGGPPSLTYTDVVISDTLPLADVTYLAGSGGPDVIFRDGVLTWKLGALPGGAKGDLTYQVVVNPAACEGQGLVSNHAHWRTYGPDADGVSDPVYTTIDCPPVGFPNNDPPYAEGEIVIDPYPLIAGRPAKVCTTIHNNSDVTQTVDVAFDLAPLGIGMGYTTTIGTPREVTVAPGEDLAVCEIWQPTTPGQQCIRVTLAAADKSYVQYSERCLDVNEVLVPGGETVFEVPVTNQGVTTITVEMVVRNACPGWTAWLEPTEFSLGPGEQQIVTVHVTPGADAVLGSGCTIDVEAWEINEGGQAKLIGGIRKVDEPQVPLGRPGEPPFAEGEIAVSPYPLIAGQRTRACVTLSNNTDEEQEVTVEFEMAGLGIGLAGERIPSVEGPNPQTVVVPPRTSMEVCIAFIPTSPGQRSIIVQLTDKHGYVAYSRRNLDVDERLTPGVPTLVTVTVANPLSGTADIDLVVDNACPGWTAMVNPATLAGVTPGETREVTLTVTPPAGETLGTGCHIDLVAYVNGVLIGGVRKIDRAPVSTPLDEPHYAEREITVDPDPPVTGQPARVCVTLANPTGAAQAVTITLAAADFGAGIPFTDIQTVKGVRIPAGGSVTTCIPWTPAPGGTTHRCLRVRVQQPGYRDIFSQRNLDVRRIILPAPSQNAEYILPLFQVRYPFSMTDSAAVRAPSQLPPFELELRTLGLPGFRVEIVDADTDEVVLPGSELWFDAKGSRRFYVRLSTGPAGLSALGAVAPPSPFAGTRGLIDIVPYVDGRRMTVDGVESGVEFEVDPPVVRFLPLILR